MVLICTLPGKISCSTAVSSSSGFSWLVSLAEFLSWLLQTPCFLPRFFEACLEACLLASCRKSAAVSDAGEQGYQPWLYFGLHSGSASLIRQGDYCTTKPPALDPTINRVWLTIVARCHTLQFTWYKFPYFTEIIGKILLGISDLGFQARFQPGFQHLCPRFQLVADPSVINSFGCSSVYTWIWLRIIIAMFCSVLFCSVLFCCHYPTSYVRNNQTEI